MAQPPLESGSSEGHRSRRMSGRGRLAVVALVIVIGVLFIIRPTPEPPFAKEDEQPIFPDMAAVELVSMNIFDAINGAAMTITRDSNGVWFQEETGEAFDAREASLMAETLVMLSYRDVIPLEPDSPLEPYGFDPSAQFFIEFLEADGTPHAVALGDVLPDRTKGYYALVDDRPAIYVIPRGAVDYLIQLLQETTGNP